MAQPQPIQCQYPLSFLEDVPELQPESVLPLTGLEHGTEPEPPSKDTFQPNDVF